MSRVYRVPSLVVTPHLGEIPTVTLSGAHHAELEERVLELWSQRFDLDRAGAESSRAAARAFVSSALALRAAPGATRSAALLEAAELLDADRSALGSLLAVVAADEQVRLEAEPVLVRLRLGDDLD